MDNDEDELAYLQPGFDPASLTVARLRNVLLTHNVDYPSSAKKPELIKLFSEEVVPRGRKLLAARARTKRSSKGIVDVPSSQASTVSEDEEGQGSKPAPRKPGRRSRATSRKASRAPDEDGDQTLTAPATASRAKHSTKHSRSVEPEEEEELPTARNTRRRTGTTPAAIVQDAPEPKTWQQYGGESPFSSDNPFQSGSSPPPVQSAGRRRTDGPQDKKTKRRSTSGRRKTDTTNLKQEEEYQPPSSSTFEIRVSDLPKSKVPVGVDDYDEVGEEFAPEERAEFERERKRAGNFAVIPVRRSRREAPNEMSWLRGLMAIVTVFLICFTYLWGQEKFAVGYCGIGRPSDRIAGVDVPDWADALRPQCENCPQHATCYSKLQATCENDFVLKNHPLSLNGILPLPPTCEPDGEKAKRVKAVADRAVDELRIRRAKAECGETDETGTTVESAGLDEPVLKQRVAEKRKRSMSDEEFEGLWEPAIGEVVGREEVTVQVDGVSGKRSFASNSLSKLSFSCSVRRSFRVTLARYIKPALILFLFLLTVMYAKWWLASSRSTEQEANKLVSNALHSLAEYATHVAYDASGLRDGYISVSQLRDDVLRDEFSASRRAKLWKRVEKKVEENSNVRTKVGTLDSGDVGRGWKWIGAIRALEDGGTGSRRGSARFSLGSSAVGSSPMTELKKDTPASHSGFTRWDESSRPQF